MKAGVEYPEYPFARFNIHMDSLDYRQGEGDHDGNEFYKEFLHDHNWTKNETDALLELCRVYELRWPVIMDRWIGKYGSLSNKKIEDLQHRYYTIGMILNRKLVERAAKIEADNLAKVVAASESSSGGILSNAIGAGNDASKSGDASENDVSLKIQHAVVSAIASSSSSAVSNMVGNVNASMQPPIKATNTGTTNQPPFDLESERQRRELLEKIWNRSKEEEMEEEALRSELKLVEAQIRKLKKSGGHILAAAAVAGGSAPAAVVGSSGPTPASSRGPSPVPGGVSAAAAVAAAASVSGVDASFAMLDAQFAATAPVPTPGIPYLQSGRLVSPATGGQMSISKATLKKMEQILKELNVNDRPLPTKRVCDMYDHVRKGALTLLTLQKAMLKKESEVTTRRNKLEKAAGAAVAREIQIKAEAAKAAAAAAAEKERIAAEKAKAREKAKEAAMKKPAASKKTSTASGNKKKPPSEKGSTDKATTDKATTDKAATDKGTKRKSRPSSKKSSTPKPAAAGDGPAAKNAKTSNSKSSSAKTSSAKSSSAKAAAAKNASAKAATSKPSTAKATTPVSSNPVPPSSATPSSAPPPSVPPSSAPPSSATPSHDVDELSHPNKRAKTG